MLSDNLPNIKKMVPYRISNLNSAPILKNRKIMQFSNEQRKKK